MTLKEELNMLRKYQKSIEVWRNENNKPQKYLWEHELGWLDLESEIRIIEEEIK